jgi:pimeloyl-ACP methyl ester carboxylesterase
LATAAGTLTFAEVTTGLSGNLIFVDASIDGTLVNATNGSQAGIVAGQSSTGSWGRVDDSCHATGATPAGHTDGLGAKVLEGNTPAGLPDLKWTFNSGSGDGGNGGGNLKPNTTYQVYAHWLRFMSWNPAVELANNASFTGSDLINAGNSGTAITSGTQQDWYRVATTLTVTTDTNGYAELWIRQPPSNRAILDGVVMREGVEPSFTSWAAGYGIAADGDGDGDNDKIPALLEYALGFNPTQHDAMPLPLPSGANHSVTWPKGAEAAGDPKISYAVQVSTNLIAWNPAAPGDVAESGTNLVLILVGGHEEFFARLAVTHGTTSGGRLTGSQPVPGWPTNVLELAYLSSADQTLQPALVYQALSNDPKPLLVALHTWSGNYLQSEPDFANWCIANDWHFIHPNFRGSNNNSNALGSELAVQDIVSAVEFMRVNCNVDTNRIYLVGVSGGGHASLLLAGRHPEIWAGVSAWCGISDIAAWWRQCDGTANDGYANNIEAACGGSPATNTNALNQCILRSPATYLAQATHLALDINHGVNDGRSGSVPFTHALYAFNVVAAPVDVLTEAQITNFYATQISPEPADPDPLYGSKAPLFRRLSGNTRVTIFDGGHEIISNAALRWLAEQRKGMAAQWALP